VYRTYNRSHILVLQTLARFLVGASQAPSYSGQAVCRSSMSIIDLSFGLLFFDIWDGHNICLFYTVKEIDEFFDLEFIVACNTQNCRE
jgi:hypothetical protein